MSPKLKAIASLILALVVFAVVIPNIVGVSVPKRQKLIDCTNTTLIFQMECPNSPPYHLLLGVSTSETNAQAFHGEVTIRQSTRLIACIPIGSDALTPCNWLPDAAIVGYVLTLSRTNQTERLSDLLRAGQTYDVQVAFTEPPSQHSSLWLSSMGKARW
jgi:hypothetical protein